MYCENVLWQGPCIFVGKIEEKFRGFTTILNSPPLSLISETIPQNWSSSSSELYLIDYFIQYQLARVAITCNLNYTALMYILPGT